jgi:predicted chitinase
MKIEKEDLKYIFGKNIESRFVLASSIALNRYAYQFGITEDIHMVRFLSQVFHEAMFINGMPRLTENLNFSKKTVLRLSSYWRRHRCYLDELYLSKDKAFRKREVISLWYAKVFGSSKEDAFKYIGRGSLMVTGKNNHQDAEALIYGVIGKEPNEIDSYVYWWLLGMAYWKLNKMYQCNTTHCCTNKVNSGLPDKEKSERLNTSIRLKRYFID